jgi:hypothetical protein
MLAKNLVSCFLIILLAVAAVWVVYLFASLLSHYGLMGGLDGHVDHIASNYYSRFGHGCPYFCNLGLRLSPLACTQQYLPATLVADPPDVKL